MPVMEPIFVEIENEYADKMNMLVKQQMPGVIIARTCLSNVWQFVSENPMDYFKIGLIHGAFFSQKLSITTPETATGGEGENTTQP